MRLIDADRLKTVIDINMMNNEIKDMFNQYVDAQPTTYDMDKVVEELDYIEMKWHKSCPPPNEYGEPMCDVDCVECQIRRCREIVKRGGVNDI